MATSTTTNDTNKLRDGIYFISADRSEYLRFTPSVKEVPFTVKYIGIKKINLAFAIGLKDYGKMPFPTKLPAGERLPNMEELSLLCRYERKLGSALELAGGKRLVGHYWSSEASTYHPELS